VAKYKLRERGVSRASDCYAGGLLRWLSLTRMHIALVCLLAAGIRVIAADVRGIVVDSQSGAGIAAVTVRLTMAGELVVSSISCWAAC